MASQYDKSTLIPHRAGFCDGLFGRACESPWKDDGYPTYGKNAEYLQGYLQGEHARNDRELNKGQCHE